MFGWFKRIFSKKEKTQQPQQVVELPAQETAPEQPTIAQVQQKQREDMAAREKQLSGNPDRPERACPKCGAPNDTFVNICWMCKEKL